VTFRDPQEKNEIINETVKKIKLLVFRIFLNLFATRKQNFLPILSNHSANWAVIFVQVFRVTLECLVSMVRRTKKTQPNLSPVDVKRIYQKIISIVNL